MNREILFRGKRIDNGEWVYGYFFTQVHFPRLDTEREYYYIKPFGGDSNSWSHFEVDPATIGQYTGLTDKNGKRIFEGDLITIPGSKRQGLPAPVKWSNFDARFEICRRGFNPICLDGDEGIYEVIGNIHDNYEFLEGE